MQRWCVAPLQVTVANATNVSIGGRSAGEVDSHSRPLSEVVPQWFAVCRRWFQGEFFSPSLLDGALPTCLLYAVNICYHRVQLLSTELVMSESKWCRVSRSVAPSKTSVQVVVATAPCSSAGCASILLCQRTGGCCLLLTTPSHCRRHLHCAGNAFTTSAHSRGGQHA